MDRDLSLRVGDPERRDVDARLQRAVGDGVLTLAEYEDRAGAVWAARTKAELDRVSEDLPAAAPPAAPGRAPRTRRALAVMSGDELTGPVAPGQDVEAYAVMGGAQVDLRRGELPAEVHVRAVAVMGGVEVLVPRGTSVQLSGLSLMGGRAVRVDPPAPGAPVVHVSAWALMGGVEVTHGSGAAVEAPAAHSAAVAHQASRCGLEARRRRGPGRRLVRLGLVAALAAGLVAGSQQDGVAVFGSDRVDVGAEDSAVDVGVLFGSVTVVVPDDMRATSGGVVVFGSTECDSACDASRAGRTVEVTGFGGFGSVQIVTQTEADGD